MEVPISFPFNCLRLIHHSITAPCQYRVTYYSLVFSPSIQVFILYLHLKLLSFCLHLVTSENFKVQYQKQSPNFKGVPVSRVLNIVRFLNYNLNRPCQQQSSGWLKDVTGA